MKKIISMIVIISVLLMVATSAVFAANSITATASVDNSAKTVMISGNISTGQGQQVTIVMTNPSGGTEYCEQTTSGSNGSYTFKHSLAGSIGGTYKAVVGGTGIDNNVSTLFTYSPVSGGGDTNTSGNTNQNTNPVVTTSVNTNNNIITINAVTGANGNATASVTADDLKTAIAGVKDGIASIQVKVDAAAKAVQVDIPAQQLSAASGLKTIVVDTGLATVEISMDVLKGSINSTSSKVTLSVTKTDATTLSKEVKAVIGDNTVYDFSLSIDEKKINSFDEAGKVKVEVPYKLKAGEDPNSIVVYYIDDSGKLVVVKNGRYDPATGKVKFSPTHFSKYAAVYVKRTFSDLSKVTWAKTSIEALAARSVIDGDGTGLFIPNGNVTRAEYIKILMSTFDLVDQTAVCTFNDVPKGAWYYSFVASAQKLGITGGKGDGSFGVNDRISREDMAVMTYRAANLLKAKLGGSSTANFADKQEISSYALDAVVSMQNAGIIQGVGSGKFAPKGTATKAQAAVIIYRLFSLYYK